MQKAETPHVVNFSGGRTSAYMVWLFEQRRKQENIEVEYVFCDTGAEHPATYQFIRDVVEHFDIELTCLRTVVNPQRGIGSTYKVVSLADCKQDLVPFLDVCMKYGTPNLNAPKCTRELKTRPSDKYANDKYGRSGYIRWLGIRADEPARLKTVVKQIDFFAQEAKSKKININMKYLALISDFTKEDILDFWLKMPFDLEIEEHLGNCVFCIKKGINKVALAARDEPEMAVKFIEMIDTKGIPEKETDPYPKQVMYRGRQSLKSIIDSYADASREEIASTIRGMKSLDSGSCSESCEAMTLEHEGEQISLLKEGQKDAKSTTA